MFRSAITIPFSQLKITMTTFPSLRTQLSPDEFRLPKLEREIPLQPQTRKLPFLQERKIPHFKSMQENTSLSTVTKKFLPSQLQT
jgi:hypothetical protein